MVRVLLYFTLSVLLISCNEQSNPDTLVSWNESRNKKDILNFINGVVTPGSEGYVSEEDRIVVIDNDGTLWSEKPTYFQLLFALNRAKELASEDMGSLKKFDLDSAMIFDGNYPLTMHDIKNLVLYTHSGNTPEEFQEMVSKWIKVARHPQKNKLYTDLIFQPMLELIQLLQRNNFQLYIVSGGGVAFLRSWAPEIYGINKENIIGSALKTVFENDTLMRTSELDYFNDREVKVENINRFIGKRPIMCIGNSDGDLAMMEYTAAHPEHDFLNIYIHHTDSLREYAYDRHSASGQFDKALDIAKERKWILVDMARDWKTIYPEQISQ